MIVSDKVQDEYNMDVGMRHGNTCPDVDYWDERDHRSNSGSIIPRTSTELCRGEDNAIDVDNGTDDHHWGQVDGDAEGDEDDEDDQEDKDIQAMMSVLMSLTVDAPGVV